MDGLAKAASMLDAADEVIVVGDVHGHARLLRSLLEDLGWRAGPLGRRGPEGSKILFLGDLIDRGPDSAEVVSMVRDLVEADLAACLMGNHEYNALLYHTPDPEEPGSFLRARNEKNLRQHEAFLQEMAGREDEIDEMIRWFRGLPLAMETRRLRAVHACWPSPGELSHLRNQAGAYFIPEGRLARICKEGDPGYPTIQTILKGPEASLPGGAAFADKDGYVRTKARRRWWRETAGTIGEALLLPGVPSGLDPRERFSGEHCGYPAHAPPVFFGHYWMEGEPALDAENAVCLDYSVGKGGPLVAYRFRSGPLSRDDYVMSRPSIASPASSRVF